MAYLKTLHENWTLTGGVFDPIHLDRLKDVRAALIDEGLIKKNPRGLDALHDQWMYLTGWTYETTFDWTGEDERCQLEADELTPVCEVLVNGESVEADFRPSKGALDITHALVEGENTLALAFYTPNTGAAPVKIGLYGGVQLRVGNAMTLEGFALTAGDGALYAVTSLQCYASGKYLFKYVVALGDEAVDNCAFTEALRPGKCEISHSLGINHPVSYDPAAPDDTLYTVRLSVEKMGVGCLIAFGKTVFRASGDKPRKVCALPLWVTRHELEAKADLLKQLGVDSLLILDDSQARLAMEMGFGPVARPEFSESVISEPAMLEGEAMADLAGGEKFWPMDTPLWRLMGGIYHEFGDFEALFGPNALGDAARAARFSRFLQAERIRRKAFGARLNDKGVFIIWPFEETPLLASVALIEYGGAARPAFDALEEALRDIAIMALVPEDMRYRPGERVKIGAWLFSCGAKRETATIDITCHALNGEVLGAIALPAVLGNDSLAGELQVTLPKEDTVVVVRATARLNEEIIARSDWAVAVTGGEATLGPFMKLQGAHLSEKNGRLVNEGKQAALGVSSLGYRALLPGEDMPVGDTYECVNGIM